MNRGPAGGFDALERVIGYAFTEPSLLARALTHSSYANEANQRKPETRRRDKASNPGNTGDAYSLTASDGTHSSVANGPVLHNETRSSVAIGPVLHNETLEFLGDAILGFVIAENLYEKIPDENEGRLSQRRAAIICEQSLAACARELGLGGLLRLGNNMTGEQSRRLDSILSDAMEAVFAAVYLDGGFDAARGVIKRVLGNTIAGALAQNKISDHKSRLQEHYFAFDKDVKIIYTVTEESGPAHKRRYTSQVAVNGRVLGTGSGNTKKESEQQAAGMALNGLL